MASDDEDEDELFQSCVSELLEDSEWPAVGGAGAGGSCNSCRDYSSRPVGTTLTVAGTPREADDRCDPETCHASPPQRTPRKPEATEALSKADVQPLRKEDALHFKDNNDPARNSQDDEPIPDKNDSKRNIPLREPSWDALASEERPVIRSVTYTRDQKCAIFASSDGVTIRVLDSMYELPLSPKRGKDNWTFSVPLKPDGATFAQMSNSTLAVVRPDSPRCVHICNLCDDLSNIAVLPLSAAVKRVELQEKVLVAMTADLRLHIFHIMHSDNPSDEVKISFITILNILHPTDSPRTLGNDGFCIGSYFDLSTSPDQPRLACKSFNGTPGSIRVYNPLKFHEVIDSAPRLDRRDSPPPARKVRRRLELVTTIDAHDHAVTRMVIGTSKRKSFLATCSSKGTSIRIYSLSEGKFMHEWYRGSRACKISSLSWNSECSHLTSFGSSGTIHVFSWGLKGRGSENNCPDEFEQVCDERASRAAAEEPTTSLLRRIRTIGKVQRKHRSFAQLRWKHAARPTPPGNQRALTLFMHGSDTNLVLFSMSGLLWRYSVDKDGVFSLKRTEDVFEEGVK